MLKGMNSVSRWPSCNGFEIGPQKVVVCAARNVSSSNIRNNAATHAIKVPPRAMGAPYKLLDQVSA